MDVSEVVDRDTLEAYLNALPDGERREVALRVAFRASLRALPIAVHALFVENWARERDLTPIAIFGSNVVSGFAELFPTVATASARAVSDVYIATADLASSVVANAISASADSAYAASDFAANNAITNAASSDAAHAAFVSTSAVFEISLWDNVRVDLDDPSKHLWPNGVPEKVSDTWERAKVAMDAQPVDWSIWVHWYERIRDGRDWYPPEMWKVLRTFRKAEDWQGDVAEINAKFDGVLGLYRAEGPKKTNSAVDEETDLQVNQLIILAPHAEDVGFDESKRRLTLVPLDQIDPEFLPNIIDQLREATEIFDPVKLATNAYQPLGEEVDKLKTALGRYNSRPVMLSKRVREILGRIDRKITAGDCPSPEQDADIEEFRNILLDVQLELIAFSSEIKRNSEAKKPEVAVDVLPELTYGATAVVTDSDSDLKAALEAELAILESEKASEEAKTEAQSRIVGLLSRSRRTVRKLIKDAGDLSADATKIVGGAALTGKGIQYLSSPEFVALVKKLIEIFV